MNQQFKYMDIVYTILFFIIGITLTSFYQLVANRLPINKKLTGRSECDYCHKTLRFIDVFPILGFLLNKGRCHFCKTRIDLKYPLTEILGGMLFSISYLLIGLNIELIITLVLISVLITESLSDIEHKIVIDKVWIIGLVIIIIIRFIQKNYIPYILSAIIMFLFLLILALIGKKISKKEVLGGGDIKIYFFIGFALNIWNNILSLFFASILGLIYALITKNTKNYLPLIPFISISVIITYLYGEDIISWYIGLFGM